MSYVAATNAIKAALVADPISADHATITLHYAPDPRVPSMGEHPQGNVDAAFLLLNETAGSPYPVVQCANPNDYVAQMRLEVCTLLHTDPLVEEQTAEARMRAIQEVLLYEVHADFVIFGATPPVKTRIGADRRIVYTWRFSMRYVE